VCWVGEGRKKREDRSRGRRDVEEKEIRYYVSCK
jgi:hypothetical protein